MVGSRFVGSSDYNSICQGLKEFPRKKGATLLNPQSNEVIIETLPKCDGNADRFSAATQTQVEGGAMTPGARAEIALQVLINDTGWHEVSTSPDLKIGEFIRELVGMFGLNESRIWEIRAVEIDRTLATEQTLYENAVRAGHHVVLKLREPIGRGQQSKWPLVVAIILIPLAASATYLIGSRQSQKLQNELLAAQGRTANLEKQLGADGAEANLLKQNIDKLQQQNDDLHRQIDALTTVKGGQVAKLQAVIAGLQEQNRRLQAAPRHGWLVWSGNLPAGKIVEIDNTHASVGSLSGSLPGTPVTIEPADPDRVTITANPEPANGWNRVVFRVKDNGKTPVRLLWVVR
jgi:hypothetical protein